MKWEGNQPLVGWCAPMGLPLRLGLETLGVGAPHLAWGALHPPWPPPPLEIPSPRAGTPLGAVYIVGGGRAAVPKPLAPPSPSRLRLAKPCRDPRYFHHHAVVLLDLHQPLLPPCWIKKEETSLLRTCVERGGAVRSALGHR